MNGEIINMDSMQIYKEIAIGTAKPTAEEMAAVPHHLFDIVSVTEEFTVADYQKRARACMAEIQSRGKLPIFVGGTGLYLSALYYDFEFRERSERAAQPEITERDIVQWEGKIDVANPRRLQRAVLTGKAHDSRQRKRSDLSLLVVWLDWPREVLHERIELRVDQMLEQGLMEEVTELYAKYALADTSSAARGIGYKELLPFLRGECTLAEARERIIIHTRQYAKRQITWVRNQYPDAQRLDASRGNQALLADILKLGGVSNED